MYTQFYRKWFSLVTPVNGKKATATLTLTGNVADGELIYIGTEIFELDTNGSVTAGHIAINVNGNVTAALSLPIIVAAINTNSLITTALKGAGTTIVITAKATGTESNSIMVATDILNGSFPPLTVSLTGGQYATPCATSCFIIIAGTWYIATKPITKFDTTGWYSFTPALIS